jgi:hypothetical protein
LNTEIAERAPRAHLSSNKRQEDRRRAWLMAQWRLFPYIMASEPGGIEVLLDGDRRPIAKVFPDKFDDEGVKILDPDAPYTPVGELSYVHDHLLEWPLDPLVVDTARGVIRFYGLTPEMERRHELLRREWRRR